MKENQLEGSFFLNFEKFLMRRWGESSSEDSLSEKERIRACRKFLSAIRGKKVAADRTIQKWFGLHGNAVPGRLHIIRLGLALHFSVEELEEYLRYGISEPGFQVNDYVELAAMYCLDHGLGMDKWEDIQSFYEIHTAQDLDIRQTAHTNRIMEMYRETAELGLEEFMVWMCRKAELFKGYSRTTYNYFCSLTDEMLSYFREETREALLRALQRTDFQNWIQENGIQQDEQEQAIRRYVKNRRRDKKGMSKELSHEIQQLYVMTYASGNRVSDLLRELGTQIEFGEDWKEIRLKNPKYISELLSVSLQKKNQMQMRRGLAVLETMDADAPCPEWIGRLIGDGSFHGSVPEAKKKLRRSLTMQTQRVRSVSRSDLLLPAQYVANKRYDQKLQRTGEEYNRDEAMKEFRDFADTILTTCDMRPLDERYRLDAALLACFREQEVVLFAELFAE